MKKRKAKTYKKTFKRKVEKKEKKNVRNPAETFKSCPACDSTSLIRLEVDVLCISCPWDSSEVYVEAGGMDDLYNAYEEQLLLEQYSI